MKTVAPGILPVIAIDRTAAKPLHRQIYESYREAIVERRLRGGQRLPSTRSLAAELQISRIPVLNAFEQLLAEGYFESRVGAGTFVASSLPDELSTVDARGIARGAAARPGRRIISRGPAALLRREPEPWLQGWGAFRVSQPAVDHFPFEVWSSLLARLSRNTSRGLLLYGDPMGYLPFREAIADYLRTSRAVRCEADQIMVVSGSQQALEISVRVLLDPGSEVWVEEPGYSGARDVLTMAGAVLVPVPVDDQGLDVAAGTARCPQARAAYVTPSHQYPLGVTMSASRRLQLLDWAQRSGAWIIEDDYDSEYRYESLPVAALQGLDRDSRVIYIGTFSKVLFPALRLGYIVIPADLVARFAAVREAMDIFPPALYQAVLADFIAEGYFGRHIRRTRQLYRERRSALVDALRDELGDKLQVLGSEAGMHLVAALPAGSPDRRISVQAARQGLWAMPLSACYLGEPSRPGLVLGYGGTAVAEIPDAVRRLRDAIVGAGVKEAR
ncbi:MAG TPA: PLP-dependent aminotransferase family protein [Thermoanaerobaculia bacterium]|nr:PLP-dependent aminotransferase family protein [Thermoanaerobaculia bacterium]